MSNDNHHHTEPTMTNRKAKTGSRKGTLKRNERAIARRVAKGETAATSRELARLMDETYGTKMGSRVERHHS